MIKCIIVDDEPIAVRVIEKHLSAFTGFEVVATCTNALEAIPVLCEKEVDLLFCDIQMPQITGVDFVRSLRYPPKVIFTTAFRDYAIEAFELNVVDYLLKPISFERFAKAIHHFLELDALKKNEEAASENNGNIQRDYIFLKADKKHYKVNLAEIFYFESMGDYVIAFTNQKKIVTKERIGNIPEMLPVNEFLQIHRRYIVSVRKIESFGPGFIEINGIKLPVGRQFKASLSRFL
jgi:DNA-binding LytR/AlgR family response regulator